MAFGFCVDLVAHLAKDHAHLDAWLLNRLYERVCERTQVSFAVERNGTVFGRVSDENSRVIDIDATKSGVGLRVAASASHSSHGSLKRIVATGIEHDQSNAFSTFNLLEDAIQTHRFVIRVDVALELNISW